MADNDNVTEVNIHLHVLSSFPFPFLKAYLLVQKLNGVCSPKAELYSYTETKLFQNLIIDLEQIEEK